jgi:hypothetical protein
MEFATNRPAWTDDSYSRSTLRVGVFYYVSEEMLERIEATIEGIGAAIEKGLAQRSKSEKEAAERKHEVAAVLARLDAIKYRLIKLREALGVI